MVFQTLNLGRAKRQESRWEVTICTQVKNRAFRKKGFCHYT